MRADRPSSTAAIVAAARAITHHTGTVQGFSDPYAERLLPASYQRRVAIGAYRRMVRPGAHLFGLRTVAIDQGIRQAPNLEQLVILGAGLDARAWRLPELTDLPVFEVDHPSTQRYKRERIQSWESRPKHHFVAVDFERDSLDERLESAGHDPDRGTVWVWEGVTMYLYSDAIDATLETVASRSAQQSRLLVTYLQPSFARDAVGVFTRLVGEPVRSAIRPEEMADRLGRFGFEVARDECGVDWHERWAQGRVYLPEFVLAAERLAAADKVSESPL